VQADIYYTIEMVTLEEIIRFLGIVLDPTKSIVPWGIGLYLLYHLAMDIKTQLEEHGIIQRNPLDDLSRHELYEIIANLRAKSDRLISERKRLMRELERCMSR